MTSHKEQRMVFLQEYRSYPLGYDENIRYLSSAYRHPLYLSQIANKEFFPGEMESFCDRCNKYAVSYNDPNGTVALVICGYCNYPSGAVAGPVD